MPLSSNPLDRREIPSQFGPTAQAIARRRLAMGGWLSPARAAIVISLNGQWSEDRADFIVNREVVTNTPTVEVTVTPEKPLPIGRQRFQLIVTDDSGNVSKPDVVVVIIADKDAPTAVLTVPNPVGASL